MDKRTIAERYAFMDPPDGADHVMIVKGMICRQNILATISVDADGKELQGHYNAVRMESALLAANEVARRLAVKTGKTIPVRGFTGKVLSERSPTDEPGKMPAIVIPS